MLHIDIRSFGYHRSGIPDDPSGNGGGFVFDCRMLPNPGREARYARQSGLDREVQDYLAGCEETSVFLSHALALVEATARRYESRGFTRLQVCFGCTGGQHRSVYCAESAARLLAERGFEVTVSHAEREAWS